MRRKPVPRNAYKETVNIDFVKVLKISNFRDCRGVQTFADDPNENRNVFFDWTIDSCCDGYVSLLMKRSPNTNPSCSLDISYTVSLVDSSGKTRFRLSFHNHDDIYVLDSPSEFSQFVDRKELFKHSDEFLPNGTLTVICKISGLILYRNVKVMNSVKKEFVYNLRMWVKHSMTMNSIKAPTHDATVTRRARYAFLSNLENSAKTTYIGCHDCPCKTVVLDTNIQITVVHCYLEFLRLIMRIDDSKFWEVIFHILYTNSNITRYAMQYHLFNFDFLFHDFKTFVTDRLQKLELPIKDEIIRRFIKSTVLLNAETTLSIGEILRSDFLIRHCQRLWEIAGKRFVNDIDEVCELYEQSKREDDIDLKRECLKCLQIYITVDTLENIFQFAIKHKEEGLLLYVAKFISENETEKIVSGKQDVESWYLQYCDFTNISKYGYIPHFEDFDFKRLNFVT